MNIKRWRHIAHGMLMSMTFCAIVLLGVVVYAAESDETNVAKLDNVNMGKGITYIYDETNAIVGVNLNGNSVIIETGTGGYLNFYYDDNRNGILDPNESKAVIGDSSNIQPGCKVYGVYQQKTENPISITVNSGTVSMVYGVYEGHTTAPISITINGGIVTSGLYGLYGGSSSESIYVTVNGGQANNVYGVSDGALTGEDATFEMNINGGSVYSMKVFSNANSEGVVKIVVKPESTFSGYTAPTIGNGCLGYYFDNKGVVKISGTYEFNEEITASTLTLENNSNIVFNNNVTTTGNASIYGNVWIESGVTVTVGGTLNRYSASKIYLSGSLNPAKTSYATEGYLFMMDGATLGTLSTGSWQCVYYPVTTSADMDKTFIEFDSYQTVTIDGMETTYLRGGTKRTVVAKYVPGYSYKFAIGNGEPVAVDANTYEFEMPRESSTIAVSYVPLQITADAWFGNPVAVKGTTYTAESPLFDLSETIKNDTTDEYGVDRIYKVKNGMSLPSGLILENGKIVGTPDVVNENGDVITFEITGRNGTSTTLNVNISVTAEGHISDNTDINEIVTVEDSVIRLNGRSVVILPDRVDATKSSIYSDSDQDREADNNKVLMIDGEASYDLSEYTICGYDNTEIPHEGDFSISVLGCKIGTIYGVKGTELKKTEVNGKLSIYLSDTSSSNNIYGTYYANVDDVDFEMTGGTYSQLSLYGLYFSQVSRDLIFKCTDKVALLAAQTESSASRVYVSTESTIGGNADVTIGADSGYGYPEESAQGYYSYYYGLHNTQVEGDVNYILDGDWLPQRCNYLAQEGSIGGNMNVTLTSGETKNVYCSYGTDIAGNLIVKASDTSTVTSRNFYGVSNATVDSIDFDIPDSSNASISSLYALSSGGKVNKSSYVYNKGKISVNGIYTISESIAFKSFAVEEGGTVTIEDDVTLTTTTNGSISVQSGASCVSYGTLELKGGTIAGILDNYGDLINENGSMIISSGGNLINREGGTLTIDTYMDNSGKIVNYGNLIQTYSFTNNNTISYTRLGTIYTAKPLTLYKDISQYLNDSNIYYLVELDYPAEYVNDVELTSDEMVTSVIEGDESCYIKANGTFTVKPGATLNPNVELECVTYGSKNTLAEGSSQDSVKSWVGTAPTEPFTVRLNYKALEGTPVITLGKTADRIENTEQSTPLVVNKSYSYNAPLYDLTSIEIENDTEEEGEVMYLLAWDSQLPDGLEMKDGKLYGTLQKATTKAQTITFTIRGKNHTTATFTLTLGKVEKCVPDWSIPTNLKANTGDMLSKVYIPSSTLGTYSWTEPSDCVGYEAGVSIERELIFTPHDTTNYDWSIAAQNAGANYNSNKITCMVSIQICAGLPNYTVPAFVTATYGQTFGEVEVPSESHEGQFVWIYDASTKVGDAGEHQYYVNYIPTDSNYLTVYNVPITLIVEPATPQYNGIESLRVECGKALGNMELPNAENGEYQWISDTTTMPSHGQTYVIGFAPHDSTNYDWTSVPNWDNSSSMVIQDVVVYVNHNHEALWSHDEVYHWHKCLGEHCDSIIDKDTHIWDDGRMEVHATETTAGLQIYTCKVCGAVKKRDIPATGVIPDEKEDDTASDITGGEDSNPTGPNNPTDSTNPTNPSAPTDSTNPSVPTDSTVPTTPADTVVVPSEGTVLAYNDTNADYVVTNTSTEAPEVSYKFTNKSATSVTIPDAIVVDGVTYKVTSIVNNAFKNHKKIKTVKMGANITSVGKNAFYGCKKLTTVKMSKNVESIGDGAFQDCAALKKIEIPSTINKIGKKAFYGCKKLTNITIKTTKLTTKNVGKDAFKKAGSNNYKKLTVKVPKKNLKAYKTMLKKRGLSAKAKVKK